MSFFSKEEQIKLARACDIVYLREDTAKVNLERLGFTVLSWHSVAQTQLAIVELPGEFRAVIIRGTEFSRSGFFNRLNDLGRNMRFWWHRRKPLSASAGDPPSVEVITRRGKSHVHSGYLRCAEDVTRAFFGTVRYYKPGLPWVVAGHSLGGATAILFAALYLPKSRVFILGAPKSCGEGMLQELTRDPISYAFSGDILAKWPWLTCRLTHPSSRKILPWPGKWFSVYRHDCKDYIRAVSNME